MSAQGRPRVGITAVGHHFPERDVTTEELEESLRERSPGVRIPKGLLKRVTGIRSRRIAAPDENASDLAVAAAEHALSRSGIDRAGIDLVLFASASRDVVEPATAHIVQHQLGTDAHVLDVSNACNSFLNGVDLARAMVLAGRASRVLVCSGEVPSRAMRTSVDSLEQLHDGFAGYTFGDVGAAMVVEPVDSGGLLHLDARAFSRHWEIGGIFGGGTRHPRDPERTYFHGDGEQLRQVFEEVGTGPLDEALATVGVPLSAIRAMMCHQVTVGYLERFVERTGVDPAKVVRTVDTYGNLASCSIPVQLSLVYDDLRPGDVCVFVGLGGGASVALAVWER